MNPRNFIQSGNELPHGRWYPGDPHREPVLLIHGGGWTSLDHSSVHGIALAIQQLGRTVFSTDYRLIGEAPWPACLGDCLAAAGFVLRETGSERILVAGASAGGHLALMTACRLGSTHVRGVLSIAGVTRLEPDLPSSIGLFEREHLRQFFGREFSEADLCHASPVSSLPAHCPPVSLLHSTSDLVVPPEHSRWMEDACRAKDIPVSTHFFPGKGNGHGVWEEESLSATNRMPTVPVRECLSAWMERAI